MGGEREEERGGSNTPRGGEKEGGRWRNETRRSEVCLWGVDGNQRRGVAVVEVQKLKLNT